MRFSLVLLLAALLAGQALLWAPAAEAARRKKGPPPLTYPRTEWRTTQYDNGTLQTEWQVYLKSAQDEPVRNGIFRRYHPNGRPALLGYYRGNEPAGVWSWLDERGNLLRQTRQRTDYDDEIKGEEARSPLSIYRTPAGQPLAEGQMKADAPHGHWLFYYPEGTPKAEGSFLTGAADGQWNYYHPDGQIERQMRFTLGVPNGPYRSGYPNGQERERGQYDQGVRTGLWRAWYPDGQLREEGEYAQDRRVGEWRTWDAQGRLVRHTRYQDGAVAAELPLPQPAPVKVPVIPEDARLPFQPRLYDENGDRIPFYDEDALQAPPPPPKGKRAPKPPPLSQWRNADQAGQ